MIVYIIYRNVFVILRSMGALKYIEILSVVMLLVVIC